MKTTKTQISAATVNEATRKRNPHLFGPSTSKPSVSIPQPTGMSTDEAKLNKLERAWLQELRRRTVPYPTRHVLIQAITLKLAFDTRYTPDFAIADVCGGVTFYETKGPQFWDDAKVKLKVSARMFPCFIFFLVTRSKDGQWKEEIVNP